MGTSPGCTHSDRTHPDSMRSGNDRIPFDSRAFDSIPFDSASDPYLSVLNWSTPELIDAMRWSPPPLHRGERAVERASARLPLLRKVGSGLKPALQGR